MNYSIPIIRDTSVEVIMNDVDDVLMNIREEIFNEVRNREISVIGIETGYYILSNK